MHSFRKIPQKIFSYLESDKNLLLNCILTFLSAITLRNCIESFTQSNINYLNENAKELGFFLLHTNLFYIAHAFSFILVFYLLLRLPIKKSACVILPCFILILMAPIIDIASSLGAGKDMLYLMPDQSVHLLKTYLTFGITSSLVSPGISAEVIFILFTLFLYFFHIQKNFLFSLFSTWLNYSIIFFWGCSPFVINFVLNFFGFKYAYSNLLLVNYFAFVLPFLAIPLLFFADKKIFISIAKDLRFLRLLHYQLMFLFGVALGLLILPISIYDFLHRNPSVVIHTIFIMFSIVLAGMFSIVMNNIIDQKIDAISNPDRPLIRGEVTLYTYQVIGYSALFLSLFYAALAGVKALFLIGTLIGIYYLYSVPPLRFKRFLLISKLAISGNSLLLIVLGFVLMTNSVERFPPVLLPIFLIGFTIAINFIDIKDAQGDAADGIKTLPHVLGMKRAKLIIGLGFLGSYLSFYFLFRDIFLLPLLLVIGCLQFYLVTQKDFRESKVFAVYLLSMASIVSYLVFLKIYFSSI